MFLGSRLTKLRTERGLTQEELASFLDVSKVIICCYEKNLRTPSLQMLIKLCDYFEIQTDYLLGRDILIKNKRTGKREFITNEEYESILTP